MYKRQIDDIEASSIPGPIVGHLGDGNFHAILLVEPNNEEELNKAKILSNAMTQRALDLGGTVTGEHGVGIGKIPYMIQEHGAAWGSMHQIKKSLDPKNILNPGKMFLSN